MRNATLGSLFFVSTASLLAAGQAALTPPFSVQSNLKFSDPTQAGIITQSFTPSDWSAAKTFPGMSGTQNQLRYQTFPFTVGKATYLQIILDAPANAVFASAYLDSYDPANPSQNYLGDEGGLANLFSDPAFFQIVAPTGHTVVLVVTQGTTAGGSFGATFTLSVEAFGDSQFNPPAPPPSAPTLVSPADAATQVSLGPDLTWTAGTGAVSYDVYFGTSASPPLVKNVSGTDYSVGPLQPLTKYYWQVASRNNGGTALSEIRSFTTLGPTINSGGVSSAAGPITQLTRGEISTIYGVNFTNPNVIAQTQTVPLPPSLAGVSVKVGGVTAPLYFVNSTQIDFQVPFEVTGKSADVVVTANGVVSAPATVTLADYGLGIFGYYRDPTTYDPIITHQDYSLVTPSHPAVAGEPLIIWATGIGLLANTPSTGAGAPGPPNLPSAVDTPIVTIGSTPGTQPAQTAQVLYAGLTPGSVGLAQINILLPSAIQAQDSPLSIQFPNDAVPSVTLYLTPPAGGASGQ